MAYREKTQSGILFRRLLVSTIVVIMMTGAFLGCLRDVRGESMRSISTAEEAAEFIELLLGEDPSSLDGLYQLSPDMEKVVSSSGGWAGLVKQISALGKVKSIGEAYADTFKGMDVYRIPCAFSLIPVDMVLVLQDGVIAGLVTDKYTGAKEKSEDNTDQDSTDQASVEEIELSVPVPALNGELPGTLTIPEGEGPFPAVVLVHGSGPNNRDEEVMNVKPFRDLADGLAEKGIAVFRYDKRTYVYGQEMAADTAITLMEETVEDAAEAVRVVSGQDRIDASRVFVLGHSLGAMAVPAIAQQLQEKEEKAAGFILMAPSARSLDELMREQYDFLLSIMPEVSEEQQQEKEKLFSELDKLKDIDALADDEQVAGAYVPYWKWLQSYDVLEEAEKISLPCLLLQGEEDYQVTMEDFNMWKEAVGDRPNWKMISYPGLVHVFIPGQKSEGSSVYLKEEHVDPQVISDIAEFVDHSAG